MPNYVCGKSKQLNNSTLNGNKIKDEIGIIILEDLSCKGYNLVDPDLMMFNLEEIKVTRICLHSKVSKTR